jgi:hypothetical protein
MTNIVASALAAGLRPADLDDDDAISDDTISASDLALIGATAKLTRIEKLSERQTAAAERAADAAEQQADAFEVIAALLASVTGVGKAYCYPGMSDGEITQQPVNFLRTGNGSKAFACDQSNAESSDDDE